MSEITPNYQAITTPRVNPVQRSQPISKETITSSSTHSRSRRNSTEQGVPDFKYALESRQHSKKEMQSLNERLANHIERTKYLQSQNKKLKDELQGLKSRWGKETEKVRQMYEVELKQLRRLLDEAEATKGEQNTKIVFLTAENKDMREQLKESVDQAERCNEKLERMNHELSDRDGEIALMRRRLTHLDEEKQKTRAQLNKMKAEMSRLNSDLDGETSNRISAQSQNQTLREEIEFLKQIHEQETKELQALINKEEDDTSRDFWRNEMGQAIHDIMREYDEKVDHVRSELETMYMTKMREMAKGQQNGTPETGYLREENKKIKDSLTDFRARISQLQARNDQLERLLQDTQQQFENERRRFAEDQERVEKDLQDTESDLRRVLNEMQVLLDAKLSLELEIAAYKKLMDADDARSLDRYGSMQSLASQKPTKRVVSPPPPVVQPQHIVSEHDRYAKAPRADISTKSQFEKNFKGNVCIEDCSPDGRYILLTNVGNKREYLHNFRILREIDGAASVRHQIQNLAIEKGESIKMWAKGFKPIDSKDHEISKSSWGMGSNVKTYLFSEEGQERAMHQLRTIYK